MWCSLQTFPSRFCATKTCQTVESFSFRQVLGFSFKSLARNCHQTALDTSDDTRKQVGKNLESEKRVIKIALIGRPNVGKSTLINQVVHRTACAVSMKAHTTRLKVKAFVNDGDTQIIFLDTPGLVSAEEVKRFKFDASFLRSAEEAIQEADIIGVLHDVSFTRCNSLDPLTIRLLYIYQQKTSFLVLNKVDAVKNKSNLLSLVKTLIKQPKFPLPDPSKLPEKKILEHVANIKSWPHFNEIFMVSALEGDGVGDIKEYLLRKALPGNWVIKGTERTLNPQALAVDLVKAACLDYLPDEVPYQLQCKLSFFEDYEEKCAVEVIVCPTNARHRRMVLDKIRVIATYAEAQLASALEKECRLRVGVQGEQD